MSKAMRHLAGSIAALVVVALGSASMHAQGASVLMFYGGALKKPVLVTEADTRPFDNLLGPSSIKAKDLADRPYLQVALFWASRTNPANNGTPLSELTPAMAWQHGRFYPPAAGKPAVLLVTQLTKHEQSVPVPSNGEAFIWGGQVSESGLAVLRRLGIIPAPR